MARTLVLHSTEGTTMAGAIAAMDRNRSWSNWVCNPATGEIATLAAGEREDRSLRNLAGGVETNNRPGVWQLEIVGYAVDIPTKSATWYRSLANIIIDICDQKGIPKRFPYPFVAYPTSYGLNAAQRLTPAQWLAVDGIVGHQHVVENDHGDPGDISRVIPYVTGGDSMAHDEDQVRRLQRFLLGQGNTKRVLTDADLGDTGENGDGVDGEFGKVTASAAIRMILKLEDRVRAAEAGQVPDDVVEMVIELDRLSARLNDRVGPDQ